MAPHMRCRTAKGEARAANPARAPRVASIKNARRLDAKLLEHSPGGARAGHASLMRPNRPLPTLLSVKSAATPKPEHCRGGHGGLGNPGASCLPFGLIARVTC